MDDLSSFAAYLADHEGLSERTVETYVGAVRLWRDWLAGRPAEEAQAVAWLSTFPSARTRNTYAAALRRWFRMAGGQLRVRVRIGQLLPSPVSLQDLVDMVAITQGRDRLLLLTLAFAGLRVHEVVELRLSDLVPDGAALKVRGKGGKERLIDIPKRLYDALRGQARGERVFHGRDRRQGLSISSVERIVKQTGHMLGIRVHAHQLRHFFGTWYYAFTRDPFRVARAMGHSDPKTTYGYAGLVQPPPGVGDMDGLLSHVLVSAGAALEYQSSPGTAN